MENSFEIVFGFLSRVLPLLYDLGGFLLSLWWIWIPWFLFILAKGLWLKWRRALYISQMDWILLEVVPPRDIKKTAQAMEQFFYGLHGTQGGKNWWEANIKGEVQRWFSLEMASFGGEIHFYIRTVSGLRNLIESHIYAQYPDAEITEVADYVDSVPADIPNDQYTLWGTELILLKEDAYPIRTYVDFEKDIQLEEQRIDPIAALMEIMSKVSPREQIWVQTLVRPINDEWKKEGEKLRDKLVGRKIEKKAGELKKEMIAWKEAGKAVAREFVVGEPSEGMSVEEKERETPFLWTTTKGEQEIITAIERNISKLGYETIIRFLYIAHRDVYQRPYVNAIVGAYKQLNTQHLNGFKPSPKVSTDAIDYRVQLKGPRENYRTKKVFADYKKRNFVQHSKYIPYLKPTFFERLPVLRWFFMRSQPFVFNTEELATVFHFPPEGVRAPLIPRVEARKREPPLGLPVE
jgi:hypothetical protein